MVYLLAFSFLRAFVVLKLRDISIEDNS